MLGASPHPSRLRDRGPVHRLKRRRKPGNFVSACRTSRPPVAPYGGRFLSQRRDDAQRIAKPSGAR
jgi:hypothetical protein